MRDEERKKLPAIALYAPHLLRIFNLTAQQPLVWAAFNRLRHVMDPHLPVPLHAQLLLFTTDILAGPLYPATVQDIDYRAIDVFVNKRVRQITGCPPHTSATLLRCELGILPSEFAAHRRQLQLWYHLHFEAWFQTELGSLVGTGPYNRLKAIAIKYGLPTLDDGPVTDWTFVNDKGEEQEYCKQSWRKAVYTKVTWAAIDQPLLPVPGGAVLRGSGPGGARLRPRAP